MLAIRRDRYAPRIRVGRADPSLPTPRRQVLREAEPGDTIQVMGGRYTIDNDPKISDADLARTRQARSRK